MSLKKIIGPLAKSYKDVDPSTIRSSAEIMKRQTNKQLRGTFWTRQSALYTVENGEATLRLTDKVEDNLIFQDIDEAVKQLRTNKNYVPQDKKSIERILGSVEGIKLTDLDLTNRSDTNEYSFFEINTSHYGSLNDTQRLLAEKAYGQGNDFKTSMRLINDNCRTKETIIYLLKPDYVKNHVEGNGAIVRLCRLDDSIGVFRFHANVNYTADCGFDGYSGLLGKLINQPRR